MKNQAVQYYLKIRIPDYVSLEQSGFYWHRVLANSTNKVITNLGLIKIRVAIGITYTQKKD